jgi:signal transduction histidine kinase
LLGVGRLVGELLLVGGDDWTTGRTIAITSAAVLFVMAGGVSGDVVARLRRAAQEVSTARARAEVARTLHDGVLQTLGVIQRRSGDEALVRLARDQDRELRTFLAGLGDGRRGLRAALRKALDRVETRYDLRAELVLVEEPQVARTVVEALTAAVGEAANNAGRHGGARRVTVFVDVDDEELFCTVKDDGAGFDPGSVAEGTGTRGSLRAPVESIGGTVTVRSRPGSGAEVTLTVPLRTVVPHG